MAEEKKQKTPAELAQEKKEKDDAEQQRRDNYKQSRAQQTYNEEKGWPYWVKYPDQSPLSSDQFDGQLSAVGDKDPFVEVDVTYEKKSRRFLDIRLDSPILARLSWDADKKHYVAIVDIREYTGLQRHGLDVSRDHKKWAEKSPGEWEPAEWDRHAEISGKEKVRFMHRADFDSLKITFPDDHPFRTSGKNSTVKGNVGSATLAYAEKFTAAALEEAIFLGKEVEVSENFFQAVRDKRGAGDPNDPDPKKGTEAWWRREVAKAKDNADKQKKLGEMTNGKALQMHQNAVDQAPHALGKTSIKDFQEKIDKELNKLADLQKQKADLDDKKKKLEADIVKLNAALAAKPGDPDLTDQRDKANKKLADLQKDIDKAQKEIDKRQQLEDFAKNPGNVAIEKGRLEADIKRLEADIAGKPAGDPAIPAIQAQLDQAKKDLADLPAVQRASERLAALQAKAADLKANAGTANNVEELQKVEDELEKLQKPDQQPKDVVAELKQALAELTDEDKKGFDDPTKKQLADFEKRLGDVEKDLAKPLNNAERADAEKKLVALQKEMDAMAKAKPDVAKKWQAGLDKAQQLAAGNKGQFAAADRIEKRIENLEKAAAELNGQMDKFAAAKPDDFLGMVKGKKGRLRIGRFERVDSPGAAQKNLDDKFNALQAQRDQLQKAIEKEKDQIDELVDPAKKLIDPKKAQELKDKLDKIRMPGMPVPSAGPTI